MLPPFGQAREDHAGQDVPDRADGARHDEIGPANEDRRRCDDKEEHREAEPDAEEHNDGFAAPIAGCDEPLLELAEFLRRVWRHR